ncbi:MAG TPA: VWA domain-containing protein, partial [Terriglobia bacterium]|nr:VWA domain-containing protein [Terriglobia bacterium]
MGRKNRLLILSAIAISLASAGYVWSQFRGGVELVVVPVNVRDSAGKLVTGLKKEDFKVMEDGVPQNVSSFS